MQFNYIPKYLNAFPQLLWWEVEEYSILLFFVGIGIVTDKSFTMAAIGFVLMTVASKYLNTKQPGFMKHYFYSKGLFGLNRIPDYCIKEFVR